MNEKLPDLLTVLAGYIIAALTGGLGGCAACAGISLIERRKLTAIGLLAYGLVGAAAAAFVYATPSILGTDPSDHTRRIMWSLLAGIVVPSILAGYSFFAVFGIRRRNGIDVQLTVRRDGEDRRGDE